jgi:hypothetical protein
MNQQGRNSRPPLPDAIYGIKGERKMSRQGKLTDPVDGLKEENELAEDMDSLDISKLTPVAIPISAARVSRPFDGYPIKKIKLPLKKPTMIDGKKVSEIDVCLTDIVLYNHVAFPIAQDQSGPRKNGKRVETYHNRWIRDPQGNDNVSIFFDRPIKTAQGDFYASIVTDPYVRCQLCFSYDAKTKRINVDKRYLLLDGDQKGPLKRCYEQVINPQLKIERAADYISGVSKDEVDIPEAV